MRRLAHGDNAGVHVVIVGGGFGGLAAARHLARARVRITLIDRQNYHLFQPLLYQVAGAVLSPADIASPLRAILRRQRNAAVRMATVDAVDAPGRAVVLDNGDRVDYDALILAAGARSHYFGHEDWRSAAPSLKTLEDALDIRQRVLAAFERAEWAERDAEQRELLTFVVIGGGPTGVELAGTLAELARRTLAREFRRIDPRTARVLLVEGEAGVLKGFPDELRERALVDLQALGVEVRLGKHVQKIEPGRVVVGDDPIAAGTILWAAGVQPVPMVQSLGVPLDRGRVLVADDLSVPGEPRIFVVGDLAAVRRPDGEWVPGVAPAAIQMGRHAAANVLRLQAERPTEPFSYRDRGTLATIGRRRAVAVLGKRRFTGWLAWLVWLFVHLMAIVGFRSRLVVLIDWAWSYVTFQRHARILRRVRPWEADKGAPV
ncbi:MAG: NAD(P)/FAD-dependent oxidoreductase [Planctomycetota bacterium]